jgi:hypothetical protein
MVVECALSVTRRDFAYRLKQAKAARQPGGRRPADGHRILNSPGRRPSPCCPCTSSCPCTTGPRRLSKIAPHQFDAEESRIKIRGSALVAGRCVISMRSRAGRVMFMRLGFIRSSSSYSSRELRGQFLGHPPWSRPIRPPEARPPLPVVCSSQKVWTKAAATDMDALAGSQQRIASCGKVPYRLAGGFRPVKQFPFPCLPDTIDRPTRRYNHKGFERSLADLVACPRKRKKEGCHLNLVSTRSGHAGPVRTVGKLLRSGCQ